MFKKILIIFIIFGFLNPYSYQISLADSNPGHIYESDISISYRNVTVFAPAVANTEDGYVGAISTVTVTIQNNGSGRVFVDTLPLTEVDMQGSARLAVKVASAIVENDKNCNVNPSQYDYFFVVRTDAPIIGGPSAGGIMTVSTISLLENWQMNNSTVMTGMINPDGSIGPIGGISQKIDAANSVGAKHFLIPKGQGTYTEMVTTTESVGGWIRTVTKPVTRNIVDYAMDNYGIAVTEVSDVYQAVEYFTGNKFFFSETNEKITTDDYIASMKPLATNLLENATHSYEDAVTKFGITNIPNKYPTYYKNDIENYLTTAHERLNESEEAYEKETYYTSTSKSFQSLIYSRFILYVCEYWDPANDTFIESLFQEVKYWYEKASIEAKNANISGFISLQSVGAAQIRASEAKQNLDEAESMYNGGLNYYQDILEFLYKLAFVVERSNSISWWINIGSYYNETEGLESAALEGLALDYIEEAQQALTYSNLLLEEIGTSAGDSATYLTDAEDFLNTARDDLEKGYHASALFQSLEAIVRANLAIETIGGEPKDKISLANETAKNKISKSREQGIEPVLAVSYYEYAESLANESDYNSALIYYKYSSMIAGVLGFTNSTIGTVSSRYVGIPIIKVNTKENILSTILIIAILTLIAGLGLGLIIGGIIGGEQNKKTQEKIIQKNPNLYTNIEKHPYFYKENIPRSIRDYYKKKLR